MFLFFRQGFIFGNTKEGVEFDTVGRTFILKGKWVCRCPCCIINFLNFFMNESFSFKKVEEELQSRGEAPIPTPEELQAQALADLEKTKDEKFGVEGRVDARKEAIRSGARNLWEGLKRRMPDVRGMVSKSAKFVGEAGLTTAANVVEGGVAAGKWASETYQNTAKKVGNWWERQVNGVKKFGNGIADLWHRAGAIRGLPDLASAKVAEARAKGAENTAKAIEGLIAWLQNQLPNVQERATREQEKLNSASAMVEMYKKRLSGEMGR